MALPLAPPLAPQLARSAAELPSGEGWCYEPKWDGFRAIVFVDGSHVFVQSRNGRPLGRYFPELRFPEGRYVLDGEIVIGPSDGLQDFAALQQRIHPAASRVELLARETPARVVAFDLLASGDESLLERPFAERRTALAALLACGLPRSVELTPQTATPEDAARWLAHGEGVVAKRLDAPYRPGERTGMQKVKRLRTLDCVVAGYRPGKAPGTVGSLMLALYRDDGKLVVVGHTSSFKAAEKRALRGHLAELETGERGSAEPSRWSADRELEWVELRPELVCEVSYDHVSDGRIRHNARFLRFRPDREPRSCTLDQLA